jgi:hypothetical protein
LVNFVIFTLGKYPSCGKRLIEKNPAELPAKLIGGGERPAFNARSLSL